MGVEERELEWREGNWTGGSIGGAGRVLGGKGWWGRVMEKIQCGAGVAVAGTR